MGGGNRGRWGGDGGEGEFVACVIGRMMLMRLLNRGWPLINGI